MTVDQVETREAQEANLLNLYTGALKHIAARNIRAAKENLQEIINSPIFQVRLDPETNSLDQNHGVNLQRSKKLPFQISRWIKYT